MIKMSALFLLLSVLGLTAWAQNAPEVLRPPKGSQVAIVVFEDLQCPDCKRAAPLLAEAGRTYKIPVVRHDYPLPMHKNTWAASNAAACADEQGKFWDMHDQLFNAQDQWNGQATSRPKGKFMEYAKALGLKMDQFEACFDSKKYQPRIKANELMATRRGASQTPTFVIGDKMIGGAISFDRFKALVDSALVLAKADSGKAAGGDAGKTVPAKGPGGQ